MRPDDAESTPKRPLSDATRSAPLRDCVQTPASPALQRVTRHRGASEDDCPLYDPTFGYVSCPNCGAQNFRTDVGSISCLADDCGWEKTNL